MYSTNPSRPLLSQLFTSLCITLFILSICSLASAQEAATEAVEGEWLKSDGDARIVLKVTDGVLNGHLSFVKDPSSPFDVNNPDEALRKRPLLGLPLVKDFNKDGKNWTGGTVYDPKKGKTYKGKIWMDGEEQLNMRGFIGVSLLGRSEEWTRWTEPAGGK